MTSCTRLGIFDLKYYTPSLGGGGDDGGAFEAASDSDDESVVRCPIRASDAIDSLTCRSACQPLIGFQVFGFRVTLIGECRADDERA